MKEYGSYLQLRGSSMFVVILYQALNVNILLWFSILAWGSVLRLPLIGEN